LGQDYGNRLGVQRGGAVSFEPQGPGVLFGALDPAVKKWYVPQELFTDYGWRQWEYSNYAQDPYERYVNTTREGDYFYDVYGNFTTRGWLIYDWRQFQPQPLGSGIFQSTRFNRWFNAAPGVRSPRLRLPRALAPGLAPWRTRTLCSGPGRHRR
jgi:hypothetical protein